MTKTKSTKRALLTSALALLVCVSMLIGSTFAWFTDSVTSSGNIIKSGTLDVTMEWADGTKAVPADDSSDWTDASVGAIFNSTLWEPGYTEVRHIKIANEGTLALKYQLNILANGEVSKLADVIDVYYLDPATQLADRANISAEKKLGTLTEVLANISTTASGNLEAGENHTITLALKMQESAGNEYQNLAIGSDFSIQLLATQLTSETDSFNNQYDAEADYVVYYNTPGTYELNATLMATKATDVITVQGADVVLNITGGYYDAGSQDCAVWARNGGVVNIYGGTFIGDGVGTATSELHQDLIYASTDSKINIYGGLFSSRSDDWLLNELDNKGEIVVYGGTFVNWNPADNVSEGPNTSFVAEGYSVIVETKGKDTYYTVVKGTPVYDASALNGWIATADEGSTITLAAGTYEGVELKGTIAKNLTIVGMDGAVVKGIHGVKGTSQLKVVGLTLENIDFQDKGLYFDNNGTPWNYVENLTMTGCTFVGTGTADTSVGNRLFDVGSDSPQSNQYFNIVIENCTVSNAIQGMRLGGVAGDGNKVVGNTITNIGHNAVTVRSTAASGAVLLVEGNTISNGGDRAFRIGTNSGIITYKDNVITNCGDSEDGSNFKANTPGTVYFVGNTVDGVAWNPLEP